MKLTLIGLGAGAACLLQVGTALAGPCSAQIDVLSKQMAATDAGMGPTGGATMDQSAANPVSPSGTPQTPTTPATGAMNEASQNKATSSQDVQNQNTGQDTMADQAKNGMSNSNAAAEALSRAQALDAAGDASCFNEVTKAQNALMP